MATSLPDPQGVLDRLLEFQRAVRDVIIRSRESSGGGEGGLHEVTRSSSADTIYRIDAEVDPILESFCESWGKTTPLVLVAEGLEDEHGQEVEHRVFPHGTREQDAIIRVIVDPIDGTRGIMYDKRAAWSLAGVAPNKGPATRLRDIEVAAMTELPTSKMGRADVLWAIKGQGAKGVRQSVVKPSRDIEATDPLRSGVDALPRQIAIHARVFPLAFDEARKLLTLAVSRESRATVTRDVNVLLGWSVDVVERGAGEIAALVSHYYRPTTAERQGPVIESITDDEQLPLRPSQATGIEHGFAMVSNFFPGTKVLASELMEHLARGLIGAADVTRATVFDDQYISTGGQFYELIVGHDRFNADLRPAFYRMQGQPEGLCCHPYDCAAMLVAEEAGVVLTNETGGELDGPFDTTTGLSWAGYANAELRQRIEPLLLGFLAGRRQ